MSLIFVTVNIDPVEKWVNLCVYLKTKKLGEFYSQRECKVVIIKNSWMYVPQDMFHILFQNCNIKISQPQLKLNYLYACTYKRILKYKVIGGTQ